MTEILTIIGGGSAYTPGLMLALCDARARHPIARVHLYDTDPAHLEIVARLCAKMGANAEPPIEVEAFDQMVAAVRGANFVLNSARPGGLAARSLDETLPLEFGIPGQETVGPGGLFFALRSVPKALELAGCVAEHAPGAVLLNYTNPTNIVCQALYDAGFHAGRGLEVVGLCDQSDEDLQLLAQIAGRAQPEERPRFQCAGLNHATWYGEIALDGQARFKGLEHKPSAPPDLDAEHALRLEKSWEMVRERPGWWPNSYLPYYYYADDFADLLRRVTPRSQVILKAMPSYFEHFEVESRKDRPVLRKHRGTAGFGDLALRYIVARTRGDRDPIVLNLPNRTDGGPQDPNFAVGTIVESGMLVEAHETRPHSSATVPASDGALLASLERYQLSAARAATLLESKLLVEALACNPLVSNVATARAMAERAKQLYAPFLELSA